MPRLNEKTACICEICNCGRHKCPHFTRLTKPTHDCVITEYNESFVPRDMARVTPYKPIQQSTKGQGKISDVTTHKTDYISYPVQDKYVHKAKPYVPNEARFDGQTMYNETFVAREAKPQKPIIKQDRRQVLGKFEGEPTYKADYKQWGFEGTRAEYRVPASNIAMPSEHFEGIPTYKTDYVGKTAPPPTSFKPQRQYKGPSGSFNDETGYKTSYVPHEIHREKAIKPESEWIKPTVPIEGMTTHHSDFTEKSISPVQPFKPINTSINAKGPPIASMTTNKADYKAWQVGRTAPIHRSNEYAAPSGEFQGDTTYVNDFIPYQAARMQPIKHPDNRSKAQGPFSGVTSYKTEYQKWDSELTKPILPRGAYEPNTVPFEGESTFKSHYQPYALEPQKSCKPTPKAKTSDEPFHGDTSYRMEFTPKRTSRCPAALLEAGATDYIFKEQDPDTGHKFYTRPSKAISTVTNSPNEVPLA